MNGCVGTESKEENTSQHRCRVSILDVSRLFDRVEAFDPVATENWTRFGHRENSRCADITHVVPIPSFNCTGRASL